MSTWEGEEPRPRCPQSEGAHAFAGATRTCKACNRARRRVDRRHLEMMRELTGEERSRKLWALALIEVSRESRL